MTISLSSYLTKRITIQELVKKDDETEIWQDKITLYAQIKTIHDLRLLQGEIFHAMQIIGHNYVQFVVRYRADLERNMRVKYGSKIYDIKRITNHNEDKQMLIIITLEMVG